MPQQPLPSSYLNLDHDELLQRISVVRQTLGKSLTILAHHYQRPEIVLQSDYRGDSLKLAQFASSQTAARYVVFCGVHFMAESADILKTADQTVILPDLGAGCDMADMANADDVCESWAQLSHVLPEDEVMPITYINSTAALKAFVGKKGGSVCTSTNAASILKWAFSQRRRVFFFPDQHLGRNTAKAMGISPLDMMLWNPKKPMGGLTISQIQQGKVFLWQGHCPVHMMFAAKQIESLLARDPEFKIIVHPECPMEVVDKAEFVGSTEYIVKTIAHSLPGTKWAVGTEMNLINRIASENLDKTVVSINPYMCLCGTMNRIDFPHLLWSLENIVKGDIQNTIAVAEPERSLAKIALERMLNLS